MDPAFAPSSLSAISRLELGSRCQRLASYTCWDEGCLCIQCTKFSSERLRLVRSGLLDCRCLCLPHYSHLAAQSAMRNEKRKPHLITSLDHAPHVDEEPVCGNTRRHEVVAWESEYVEHLGCNLC